MLPGLRNTPPLRVTEMRIASSLSAACMVMGFLVFTRSTLTPLVSMGVMTMKMMSSTSITSTMGVTLMSATGGGAFFFSIPKSFRRRGAEYKPRPFRIQLASRTLLRGAGALHTLQEVIQKLGAGVTHLHVERVNAVGEVVEGPNRGDGHEQTDSGGAQRFRNTARH